VPNFRIRHRTNIVLPEQPVPIARDQVVLPVAEAAGKESEELPERSPDPAELLKDRGYGVISRQHAFIWLAVIEHEVNSVEYLRVSTVAQQDPTAELALQCGETKTIIAITLQNELH